LPTASYLKYLYLAYLSSPAKNRILYRTIRKRHVRKILEVGFSETTRTLRMINLAHQGALGEPIRYTAIDLFEARGSAKAPGLSLKEAHRLLKGTQAQIQLIPGDPASALARNANALSNIDLLLISADHDDQSLAGAWFYLPRMLHASSTVYVEKSESQGGEASWTLLERDEIDARAVPPRRRSAA